MYYQLVEPINQLELRANYREYFDMYSSGAKCVPTYLTPVGTLNKLCSPVNKLCISATNYMTFNQYFGS